MTVILPFTCKQLIRFGLAVGRTLWWIMLIGLPLSLIIQLYRGEFDKAIGLGIFTGIAWFTAILWWAMNGQIKCKCEEKQIGDNVK